MAQKRIKRTDQEWFDLIKDCKNSSLKVKIWCEQYVVKAVEKAKMSKEESDIPIALYILTA